MANWEITFLGTGSYASSAHRSLFGVLVDIGGSRTLIDCPDGSLARMRGVGLGSVDRVLLTDTGSLQTAGLLALGEFGRRGRRPPLPVFGPPGTRRVCDALADAAGLRGNGLFETDEVSAGDALDVGANVTCEALEMAGHGAASPIAYLTIEPPLPGRVDTAAAAAHGIRGAEFQQLLEGRSVRGARPQDIIGRPRLGRRVVLAARGRLNDESENAFCRADLVVVAAPFMDERLEVALEAGFLTGLEAAAAARRLGVRCMAVHQIGPWAPVGDYLAEARQAGGSLIVPEDGDRIELPLPDVGPPRHTRQRSAQRPTRGAPPKRDRAT